MDSTIVNEIDLSLCRKVDLPLVTVYYNTSDFPGKYLARLWDMDKPTPYAVVRDTLDLIRLSIPTSFMSNLGRQPLDDPNIVEVWL